MIVGVDIGGTKVLAGEVTADGQVGRTARRQTPGRRVPAPLVEAALTEAVLEVAAGERLEAVGLAAAGFVDVTRTRVLFAPHLPWRGDDVVARLSAAWGVPVRHGQRRQLLGGRRDGVRRGARRPPRWC